MRLESGTFARHISFRIALLGIVVEEPLFEVVCLFFFVHGNVFVEIRVGCFAQTLSFGNDRSEIVVLELSLELSLHSVPAQALSLIIVR